MQFFALIMINAAMFAIFYLLISLKLERKATEFREKKLRRLMEEMIADFNETAERNISLLENRINTMKRLLRSSGGIDSLDVSVAGEMDEAASDAVTGAAPAAKNRDHGRSGPEDGGVHHAAATVTDVLSHGAGALADKLRKLVKKAVDSAARQEHAVAVDVPHHRRDDGAGRDAGAAGKQESLIEKDLSLIPGARKPDTITGSNRDEEEISGLFKRTGDKYALAGDLYGKGYSIELISRCSGIPQGEIRLVLNLNM